MQWRGKASFQLIKSSCAIQLEDDFFFTEILSPLWIHYIWTEVLRYFRYHCILYTERELNWGTIRVGSCQCSSSCLIYRGKTNLIQSSYFICPTLQIWLPQDFFLQNGRQVWKANCKWDYTTQQLHTIPKNASQEMFQTMGGLLRQMY